MKTPQFIQLHHDDAEGIRQELMRGLCENMQPDSASVSPKYLYDALGSRLFEAITELPEYYPTRTEAVIFRRHSQAMAEQMPSNACLIDLGAGNCGKAASLFTAWTPSRYVAVDISVEFLKGSLESLQRQFPQMDMLGVGMDFSQHLELPSQVDSSPPSAKIVFYPGSSIGNFTPPEALAFLRRVHRVCADGLGSGLLIGVDLVKDSAELEAAYDDALGVTAAFNRNLISHINRLTGCDMRLADWAHRAVFNQAASRIEMHLVAQRDVTVRWPDGNMRQFAQGEQIHTENSYKWTVSGFAQLLQEAGFSKPMVWTDVDSDAVDAAPPRFAVMWARA